LTISPLPQLDTSKKKKSGVQLNLKKAELKNVTFIKKDAWLGEDMRIRVGALNLDANNLGLTGNRFEINSLQLINPGSCALQLFQTETRNGIKEHPLRLRIQRLPGMKPVLFLKSGN
jgi:hypothetical protein